MLQAITYSSYSILESHIISYYLLPFCLLPPYLLWAGVVMASYHRGQVVPLMTKDLFSCQNFFRFVWGGLFVCLLFKGVTTYSEFTLFFLTPTPFCI